MAEPFAEIMEKDATGRTAETYAEIRAGLGAPMVNLVYRHMATVPGCLDWAWAVLRPSFASGAIQRHARELVAALDTGPPIPVPREALRVAGLDAEGEATVVTVLDAYNRANPINVIAFHLLARALEEPPGESAADTAAPTSDAPMATLPPLLDVSRATPELAALLGVLARQAGMNEPGVTPTLFRHVGHWPGFLSLVATVIAGLIAARDVDAAAAGIAESAQAAARMLPLVATDLPPPTVAQRETVMKLVRLFPPSICRMIFIGAHLRRCLPG